MKLTTLKKEMTKVIELVKKNTKVNDLSNQEIEHLINYAMYEILYLPKRSARDRIIKPGVTSKVVDPKDVPFKSAFKNSHTIAITDDRPCDTETPDNIVRVDFSND